MNTPTATLEGVNVAQLAMCSPIQKQVDRIQDKMLTMPQVECPLKHCFTPGLYYRELFVPKGTFLVTKVHQTEHPFVIASGRLAIWTEKDGLQRIKSPHIGVTKPGTRRLAFTYEDCVWLTFHATEKTDLDELEDFLFYQPEKDSIPVEVVEEMKQEAA